MPKAPAWILPITPTVSAAVGEFELVHVLPEPPALFEVPRAPRDCRRVLVWQNRIVPVMDLAVRFRPAGSGTEPAPREAARIGIVAYQEEGTGALEFGALILDAPPRRGLVADAQACRLPADLEPWLPYASSGFRPEGGGRAIPILRLSRLFSPRDTRAPQRRTEPREPQTPSPLQEKIG